MRRDVSQILRECHGRVIRSELRGLSDGELLARFVADRDESAFSAIVERHGPLVLGVCRRALGRFHDAEDAFQATFLVLARKAYSIRRAESLSSWLHGVAHRTAQRLRTQLARHCRNRLSGGEPVPDRSPESAAISEAMRVFDEELLRLHSHDRSPLILCYLEGKTHDEAARQLGWSLGTFRGRLERARAKLRIRLTQRGISVPAVLMGLGIGSSLDAAMPASLATAAVKAACGHVAGGISPAAVGAAEAACQTIFAVKSRSLVLALGCALLLGVGTATTIPGFGGPIQRATADNRSNQPTPKLDEVELVQQLGHPKFAQREAAAKQLRQIGLQALPALRLGTKSTDPEIVRRSVALLSEIEAAEWKKFVERFRADASGKQSFDHPIWLRYKSIAGDNSQSRKIFGEMIDNENRVNALLAADVRPDSAGTIYAVEISRQLAERDRKLQEMTTYYFPIIRPGDKGPPHRGDFATILLLGSYPATGSPPLSTSTEAMYIEGEIDRTAPAFENPMRKLYAVWAANRLEQATIKFALRWSLSVECEDCLPLARRVAADVKLPSDIRASAFPVLARFGDKGDIRLMLPLCADRTVYGQEIPNPGVAVKVPPRIVQVRDIAVVMMLVLDGKSPSDFDFPYSLATPNAYVKKKNYTIAAGFRDDASRDAAHAKVKDWLEKQKQGNTGIETPREPSVELRAALNQLEGYRHSSAEKFAEMEQLGRELLAKYTDRDDQARIKFQLAHVYAQSDISKHYANVEIHARAALRLSRDPGDRGTLYSYLASAAEVNPNGGAFPQRRKHATEWLLQGYNELAQLPLPKIPPELPAVGKHSIETNDPAEQAKARVLADEELRARREAEFIRALVQRRETLIMQVRDLYAREPFDVVGLAQLVQKWVKAPKAATELLERAAPKQAAKRLTFKEQVDRAEAQVAQLKLVELWKSSTSIDTRHAIRFVGKNGEVKVPAGSAVLVELAMPVREVGWKWGDIKEAVGDNDSPPFTHLLCKWESNGKLTWIAYAAKK